MPKSLGAIHPRYLTPHVSTILIGILATVWYVPLNLLSENFLFDTLSALSLSELRAGDLFMGVGMLDRRAGDIANDLGAAGCAF